VRRLFPLILLVLGCPTLHSTDGVEVARLPPEMRDDYAIFADRCSKCHSLARPLTSGIDDDEYWRRYVARMKRQPSSGITEDDTPRILNFLYYYSAQLRAKKQNPEAGTL